MSRSVRRFRFVALGCLGAAASFGSSAALADAAPVQAGESCAQWASRMPTNCRLAKRHGAIRTAMVEPRRTPFFVEPREAFPAGRYTSLLILGVGF